MERKKKERPRSLEETIASMSRRQAASVILFVLGAIQAAVGLVIQNYIPLIFASCLFYAAVRQKQAVARMRQKDPQLLLAAEHSVAARRGRLISSALQLGFGAVILYAALRSVSVIGLMGAGALLWLGVSGLWKTAVPGAAAAAIRRPAAAETGDCEAGGTGDCAAEGAAGLAEKSAGRTAVGKGRTGARLKVYCVLAAAGLFLGVGLVSRSAAEIAVGAFMAYYGIKESKVPGGAD